MVATLERPLSVGHVLPIPTKTKQDEMFLPSSFGTIARSRMNGTITGQLVVGEGYPMPAMIVSF